MENMTLRQAVEKLQQQGITIHCGNFDTLEDFFYYFDNNYKPTLQQLQEDWACENGAKRFLADDLLALLAE